MCVCASKLKVFYKFCEWIKCTQKCEHESAAVTTSHSDTYGFGPDVHCAHKCILPLPSYYCALELICIARTVSINLNVPVLVSVVAVAAVPMGLPPLWHAGMLRAHWLSTLLSLCVCAFFAPDFSHKSVLFMAIVKFSVSVRLHTLWYLAFT